MPSNDPKKIHPTRQKKILIHVTQQTELKFTPGTKKKFVINQNIRKKNCCASKLPPSTTTASYFHLNCSSLFFKEKKKFTFLLLTVCLCTQEYFFSSTLNVPRTKDGKKKESCDSYVFKLPSFSHRL